MLPMLALALPASGTLHSSAATDTTVAHNSNCIREWSTSPASNRGSSASITANSSNQCHLVDTRSTTVAVATTEGGEATDTAFAPSMDLTAALDDVDGMDVCFAGNTDGTAFTAAIETECSSFETTSRSANRNGPTPAADQAY